MSSDEPANVLRLASLRGGRYLLIVQYLFIQHSPPVVSYFRSLKETLSQVFICKQRNKQIWHCFLNSLLPASFMLEWDLEIQALKQNIPMHIRRSERSRIKAVWLGNVSHKVHSFVKSFSKRSTVFFRFVLF